MNGFPATGWNRVKMVMSARQLGSLFYVTEQGACESPELYLIKKEILAIVAGIVPMVHGHSLCPSPPDFN